MITAVYVKLALTIIISVLCRRVHNWDSNDSKKTTLTDRLRNGKALSFRRRD